MSASRVPTNAAALVVGRVVSAVAAIAVIAIAAHRLSVEDFGLVVSVKAAGFLMNTFLTFGTDTVIVRALAAERSDARSVIGASLRLQVVGAVLCIAVAAAVTWAGAEMLVLIEAITLVPLAVVAVANAALRGTQRMDLLLWATGAGSVVALASCLILFQVTVSPWVPIAAFGLGGVVTAAVAVVLARPLVPAMQQATPLIGLVREAAPFAMMVVLAAIGAQVGPLLVEFFSDDTAGGYGAAVRVSEAARLVPGAVMGAFFPAMLSGLHRTERYRRWMRWLSGYAVFVTGGLLLIASLVNRVLFADQPGGETLIRILSLGLIVTVARLALSFELIAEGRERTVLVSALAGAGVVVLGGLAAAPRFGAEGVAWMQLAGLVVATIVLAVRRSAPAEATPTRV